MTIVLFIFPLFSLFACTKPYVLTCLDYLFAYTILKLIGTRRDDIRRIHNKESDSGGAQVSGKNPSQHRFALSV